MCKLDIEGDSEFKGSKVFTIHKRRPHGKKFDEDSKDQRETKTIRTNHTVISKKP
jgi:hypothetical protein